MQAVRQRLPIRQPHMDTGDAFEKLGSSKAQNQYNIYTPRFF